MHTEMFLSTVKKKKKFKRPELQKSCTFENKRLKNKSLSTHFFLCKQSKVYI